MNKKYDISDYHLKLIISLFLIFAIIIAYGQVRNFDFISFDDTIYVSENRLVQTGLTLEGFIWAFTTTEAANWHPLTWLSHMLDCQIYGLNPMGHHWTNLLFHIANTLLLFFVFKRMTGALWRSAFVAALFALHPLHVESVAWISERKDVLSTFWGLLIFFAYYRYVKISGFKNYLLVIIFFGLGLMAKTMLVTFPFVLLLLDFWPLQRLQFKGNTSVPDEVECFDLKGFFKLIWEKIPLFVLAAIASVLTYIAQQSKGAMSSPESFPLQARIANAFVSYVSYVLKAIWPGNLAIFYPHQGNTLPAWQIIGAVLLIAVAIFLSIRTSKKYPYIAVGLFWYLGTLVPVIGLVQVGDQAMADRYTYIPLIGLFIVVAWGASDLSLKLHYRKIFLGISAVIILSALTVCTFFQVTCWKNSITLFEHAIYVTENNALAHNSLGGALFAGGKFDKAIFHFKEALRIVPTYAGANNNLAVILADQGELEKSVFHYNEALKCNPEYATAHHNLSLVLLKQKKTKEAYLHLTEAIKINPDYADAYNQIGVILSRQGKFKKAGVFFSKAIQIRPNHTEAQENIAILKKILSTDKS